MNLNGNRVKLFLNETDINIVIPYIIEGNNLQFSNKASVNEIVSWFRISGKELMLIQCPILSEEILMI